MGSEIILFRIVLSAIVGFVIGIVNKNYYNNPSGIIFSLICIGACLITITSTEFYKLALFPWTSDPGRLSAQIISALGFLGTGLIWINENNEVKGTSVAASLWLTAILGMLIGAGLNNTTVVAVSFFVFIFWISKFLNRWNK